LRAPPLNRGLFTTISANDTVTLRSTFAACWVQFVEMATVEDLVRASIHAAYESKMLRRLSRGSVTLWQTRLLDTSPLLRQALMESFIIHARCLLQAAGFIPKWDGMRPPVRPTLLPEFRSLSLSS
jgi:hypothetical protein